MDFVIFDGKWGTSFLDPDMWLHILSISFFWLIVPKFLVATGFLFLLKNRWSIVFTKRLLISLSVPSLVSVPLGAVFIPILIVGGLIAGRSGGNFSILVLFILLAFILFLLTFDAVVIYFLSKKALSVKRCFVVSLIMNFVGSILGTIVICLFDSLTRLF